MTKVHRFHDGDEHNDPTVVGEIELTNWGNIVVSLYRKSRFIQLAMTLDIAKQFHASLGELIQEAELRQKGAFKVD